MNKNENLVVAIYNSLADAESAAERLQKWDKETKDVKLGPTGLVFVEGGAIQARLISGGFFNLSFPMPDDAILALGNGLNKGEAAVVVSGDDYEVSMIKRNLEMAGGRILSAQYEVTDKEAKAAQKAADSFDDITTHKKGVDRSLTIAAINKTGFN